MPSRKPRNREAARAEGHLLMLQRHLTLTSPARSESSRSDRQRETRERGEGANEEKVHEEVKEQKEEKEEKNPADLLPEVDPNVFAARIIREGGDDDEGRRFWMHLTRDCGCASLNWDADNPYRPWKSEFEMIWWFLFIQRDWAVSQFDDVRTMVIWMIHSGMLRGVSQSACRTFRTLRRVCSFLPGIPPPMRDDQTFLTPIPTSSQSQLDWRALREAAESDTPTPQPSEGALTQSEMAVLRNPVRWYLQLGLLIPDGWNSLRDHGARTDYFSDSDTQELDSICDSPIVSHWNILTRGRGWALIRSGKGSDSRLLLSEGNVYKKVGSASLFFVRSIQTLQCTEWVKSRLSGSVDGSDEFESTVSNRRPYLRIGWHVIEMHDGRTVLKSEVERALVGTQDGRNHSNCDQIVGCEFFKNWEECPQTLDWTTVTADSRAQGASALEACRSLSQRQLPREHPVLNDKQCVPVLLYFGFDAYAATGFARSTSSITNFYVKCANKESGRHPFQLYCSLKKGVPYHFVIERFWSEMQDLQDGISVLVCVRKPDSGLKWVKSTLKGSVVGVICDLENMEPLMQCVRSRKDSRTQGSFYRGADDALSPGADFSTLDPRYLKTRDWWRRINGLVRASSWPKTTVRKICTAEGLSHHLTAHRWVPKPRVSFNEMIQGVSDAAHDFDRIFECIRINILNSLGSDKTRMLRSAMAYLDEFARVRDYIVLPADPLALRKTAKSDFRQNYRRTLLFYLAFAAVAGDKERVGVLRMALECYCMVFQCRSGAQVFALQCRIVHLLQKMEEHFQGDPENVCIPKARDLLKLAFVTLPLFRSNVAAQNLDLERTHRIWKRLLSAHSNYKGDFINNAQKRMREKISAEYIWSGGVCGPRMNWSMDPAMRERCHPLDATKPLFEPPCVLGFGMMHHCSLRFDSVTQFQIGLEDENEEWWRNLGEFAMRMSLVDQRDELTSDCVCYRVRTMRIFDYENSDTMRVQNHPILFCGTYEPAGGEYTPFVQIAEDVIKIVNLRKCGSSKEGRLIDLEKHKESVLMASWGALAILALPADSSERKKSCKLQAPLDYHFRIGRRRASSERYLEGYGEEEMGGDELGKHWVPGCCVIGPAATVHVCKVRSRGRGCGMRDGKWKCDMDRSPYLEIIHPKWLYSPSLFRPQKECRVTANQGRKFVISNLV